MIEVVILNTTSTQARWEFPSGAGWRVTSYGGPQCLEVVTAEGELLATFSRWDLARKVAS